MQMAYAFDKADRRGTSKKGSTTSTRTKSIFSTSRKKTLTDTSKSLMKFVKSEFGIRRVVDIKTEHVNAYIRDKSPQWSSRTTKEKISQLSKIAEIAGATYGKKLDWRVDDSLRPKVEISDKMRTLTMTRDEHSRLVETALRTAETPQGRMTAADALRISAATGMRSGEIAHLRGAQIDLDRGIISIREGDGAKNDKFRDISIREKDRALFAELKERKGEGFFFPGHGTTPRMKAASISAAMHRTMEKCGMTQYGEARTSNHSIRKMWAQERLQEAYHALTGHEAAIGELKERGPNDPAVSAAWGAVQKELGHGPKFRDDLWEAYVGR